MTAAAVLVCACGSGELNTDEQDIFDRGADSHSTVQQSLGLSDAMFQFDPTLDVTKTVDQNTTALQQQALSQLNGCGAVTVSGTTVTVAFGAPPGCTLKNGITVSGTADFALTQTAGTVTVSETFTQLLVNGTDLNGTATFSTQNGSTFSVSAALTSNGNVVNAALTVTGSATAITIDGTVNLVRGPSMTTAQFSAVVWGTGDCYPKSGSVKLTKGTLSETMTFMASSASTGKVQVTLGRGMFTQSLPAYGTCPKS